uniref:Chondromodulin n=1 Tax=Oncorhynchus kisutch TaxID=8019 RepID=A0A8C7DJV8_ONCKI
MIRQAESRSGQADSSAAKPPVAVGRLLRFGVATLVLMLCGSIGAFHLWKVSDKNVKLYLSFIKVEEGSMEIDYNNNLERFRTGRDSFLSTKILDLCGDLPVFWLQTTYPKDGERRTRDTQRAKRQFDMKEFEAAAEEKNTRDRGREEGAVTFDAMLDHQGIFCSECRHSYTHCQRICEPLGYNYRGCQVSYRDILPCRWWVVCILGVVSVVHAHFLKPNSPKVLKVMFCKQQCHLYADIYCITLYLVANTG